MSPGGPASVSDEQVALLLDVTGRNNVGDALHWIAEGRPVAGGLTTPLLAALVCCSEMGMAKAEDALRAASRLSLTSKLDTSADLLAVDSIAKPNEYEQALAEVAGRTATGSLADINVNAVTSAQSHNPLVMETLGLVAGLSWRDLRDRSEGRQVPLPGESSGPWKRSQIASAFAIVDEVVTGRVEAQLAEAVAARPVELLLTNATGWAQVETQRTGGVSYGTLLAQRDVGSAWSAHRNRTNAELSRLLVVRLLDALDEAGIGYWSTEGENPVTRKFLTEKAVHKGRKSPGQLSAVTRAASGEPNYAVLVSIARDGGTARKTASTFLGLPGILTLPGILMLVGTGWAARSETDQLVRAFRGRVFTEKSLSALALLAATPSPTPD